MNHAATRASATGTCPATPRWRVFGQPGDLDMDLRAGDRAERVTCLLARCRVDTGESEAEIWNWSLSARLGALSEVVALTLDHDALSLQPRCAGCGETYEVDLSLTSLSALGEAARTTPRIELALSATRHATLRRPTGADQRRWRAEATPSEAILKQLMVEGALGSDLDDGMSDILTRVAEAMQEADPLAAFAIHCVCPFCARDDNTPVDLEGLLLDALARQASLLTRQVHQLASRYGWREADILALPAHRRAAYLDCIEREAGWP